MAPLRLLLPIYSHRSSLSRRQRTQNECLTLQRTRPWTSKHFTAFLELRFVAPAFSLNTSTTYSNRDALVCVCSVMRGGMLEIRDSHMFIGESHLT